MSMQKKELEKEGVSEKKKREKQEQRYLKTLSLDKLLNKTKTLKVEQVNVKSIKISVEDQQQEAEVWKLFEIKDAIFLVTPFQHIYAFGNNEEGRLGIDSNKNVVTPTRVSLELSKNEEIKDIYCSEGYTFITTTFTRIYATGRNYYGHLGINSLTKFVYTLSKVDLTLRSDEEIKDIYCFPKNSFITTTASNIYATGSNNFGQLGINASISYIYSPKKVHLTLSNDEEIKDISNSIYSTFISTTASRIYATGYNEAGQLGINSFEKYIYKPTKVHLHFSHDERLKEIFTLSCCTFISTTSNRLYATGWDGYGQLGINGNEGNIFIPSKVHLDLSDDEVILNILGASGSTFIRTTSSIYAIGCNNYGKLGINLTENIIPTPTKVHLNLRIDEEIKDIGVSNNSTIIKTESINYTIGMINLAQLV